MDIKKHKSIFDVSSRLLDCNNNDSECENKYIDVLPIKYGNYNYIEEHFFKIIKVDANHTHFDILPCYIDKNKVIIKKISESYEYLYNCIPTKLISKYKLLSSYYVDKYWPEHITNDIKYDYFASYLFNNIIDIVNKALDQFKNNLPFEENDINDLLKRLNKNYRFDIIIYDIYDQAILEEFKNYLAFINEHKKFILENLCTNTLSSEIQHNMFTTINEIFNTQERLYNFAIESLGEYVSESLTYLYNQDCKLDYPQIIHNITKIKLSEIYRVFNSDPTYQFTKTNHVSNWSGIILDENARNCCAVGNSLRLSSKVKGSNYSSAWYWKLIYKVSETRYLASIINIYCATHEDIILIIDTGSITEIPTSWPGNDSFHDYENINSGLGYSVTGLGALSNVNEEEMYYDVDYNGLVFTR